MKNIKDSLVKAVDGTGRRDFLKMMGVVGGGLVIGVPQGASASPYLYAGDDGFQLDGLLQINDVGEIIFYLPRAEMGQGISTGLATLIAEELKTPPSLITIRHCGVHEEYQNPLYGMQVTGGSTSMLTSFMPLRKSAAALRFVLLEAAATDLKMDVGSLHLKDGKIWLAEKAYSLNDFFDTARIVKLPKNVPLTPHTKFRFIGKDVPRVDALAKVTGQATFGIDVGTTKNRRLPSVIDNSDRKIPDLKKAALVRCPVIGGKVKTYNSAEAEKVDGVNAVVPIFNGVAVVADHYWQAKKASAMLTVEWELPELAQHSSADIRKSFEAGFEQEGQEAFKEGDSAAALISAPVSHTAQYHAPYLAHATMEPMNCTAWLQGDEADIWAPTQGPDVAQTIAAEQSGIDRDNIRVHSTYLGGGFGRRANQDYVAEAVAIAKKVGLPVQLLWSREDDMRNDFYRPAASVEFKAGLDQAGRLTAWEAKRVGPNIMGYTVDEAAGVILPEFLPAGMVEWISKRGHGVFKDWTVDHSGVEGLWEDYDCPNKEVRQVTVDPGLRLGFWRSVGHSFTGFFKESFMDELSYKAEIDPLQFRLDHCGNNPRLASVLKRVAKISRWDDRKNLAGRSLGIASVMSFNSFVAQVVEASVEAGQIKVHKVYCVVDCGRAVNPDIIRSQMEGGIIFGLSAAMSGEITLKDGAVEQSNFHDYSVLRMNQTPDIVVEIVDSSEAPTGVGEPGVPPIAPAVANAIYAASGVRLRELPLKFPA